MQKWKEVIGINVQLWEYKDLNLRGSEVQGVLSWQLKSLQKFLRSHSFSEYGLGAATSLSHRTSLEMQTLEPQCRPAEPQSLCWAPAICVEPGLMLTQASTPLFQVQPKIPEEGILSSYLSFGADFLHSSLEGRGSRTRSYLRHFHSDQNVTICWWIQNSSRFILAKQGFFQVSCSMISSLQVGKWRLVKLCLVKTYRHMWTHTHVHVCTCVCIFCQLTFSFLQPVSLSESPRIPEFSSIFLSHTPSFLYKCSLSCSQWEIHLK